MNRLFAANFVRMLKDKFFWIGILIMVGMAGVILFFVYRNSIAMESNLTVDGAFFIHMVIIGVLIASFCSMFLGTEYSDGTIRNKLVVGHKRSAIYVANLATVFVAGIFMYLAYIAVIALIGIPVFGTNDTILTEFLFSFFTGILVIAAFSALFTMLSMCIQNRTIVMNISIIGFFILMFTSIYLCSSLNEEPMWKSYIYQDAEGTIVTVPEEPNPNYVSGMKREVYCFLFDFLPTGQDMQLYTMSVKYNWHLPSYSFFITAASTAIGLFCFRKKDIK